MGSAKTPTAPSGVPVGRATSCQQQKTNVKVGVWQHELLWFQFKAPALKKCALSKANVSVCSWETTQMIVLLCQKARYYFSKHDSMSKDHKIYPEVLQLVKYEHKKEKHDSNLYPIK